MKNTTYQTVRVCWHHFCWHRLRLPLRVCQRFRTDQSLRNHGAVAMRAPRHYCLEGYRKAHYRSSPNKFRSRPGWCVLSLQISKTHKMKTMSKKQLRQIKKRQVNSRTGEIEFVSPWGGGKKK